MSTATDTADSIIKYAIYEIALKAAESAAIAQVPWLAMPVVNQIFTLIMGKFADLIFTALDQAVIFSIINIETAEQRQAYDDSVVKLHQVVDVFSYPSQEARNAAVQDATLEFKNRLANLIRIAP